MHLGKMNINAKSLGGAELGYSELEKDMEVLIENRVDSTKQCQAAADKASRILEHIKKGIYLWGRSKLFRHVHGEKNCFSLFFLYDEFVFCELLRCCNYFSVFIFLIQNCGYSY